MHIRISIYGASVWTELLEGIMFWKISVQYNINISIHICKRCLYMSIFDWIMGLQLYSLMHFSIHGVPQLAYILSIFFRNGCKRNHCQIRQFTRIWKTLYHAGLPAFRCMHSFELLFKGYRRGHENLLTKILIWWWICTFIKCAWNSYPVNCPILFKIHFEYVVITKRNVNSSKY